MIRRLGMGAIGRARDGAMRDDPTAATTEWTAERPAGPALGHILVTFRISRDDDGYYVGECQELGVSSFGNTLQEALDATVEATEAYLQALDETGERDRVFSERGVQFYRNTPPDDLTEVPLEAHPGEVVSPQRLSQLVDA